MNRTLVLGIAILLAVVGLSLMGGQKQAVAGHGCHGGSSGGGGCSGGGDCSSGGGSSGGCHSRRHGGLFGHRNRCHGSHGSNGGSSGGYTGGYTGGSSGGGAVQVVPAEEAAPAPPADAAAAPAAPAA